MRQIVKTDFNSVKDLIEKANPLLAKAIETIPAAKQPPLILATYEYGDQIIKNSTTYLPDECGQLLPLSDLKPSHFAKQLLGYSQIPVGIVINKTCEVYVEYPQQIIPLNCIHSGSAFGLFESLADKQVLPSAWSVAAGSRSIFLLPSISDFKYHSELKRQYGLSTQPPKHFKDQFHTFKELVARTETKWQCQVVFLTKDWFKNKTNDWLLFRNFLLELAWSQFHYLRDEHNQSFIWERLMAAVSAEKIKPSPYQLETIKHLTAIHAGCYPGYMPAPGTSTLAPIKLLQKLYVDAYGLNQAPIFMVPQLWRLRHGDKRALYYSLAYPTVLLGNHLRSPRGFIQEIHAIKQIVTLYEAVLSSYAEEHQQVRPPLMKLNYFHPQSSDGIYDFNLLPEYDERFMRLDQQFKDLPFPSHSAFGRGCIQIQTK